MYQKLFASLVLLPAVAVGQGIVCSAEMASAAEDAVDQLPTWTAIHKAFQQYGSCDDGGVAEGFSDQIVHLIATRWGDLKDVYSFTEQDPLFRAFVLRHIDSTADTDELGKIRVLAHARCPEHMNALCQALGTAATAAEKEAKAVLAKPQL